MEKELFIRAAMCVGPVKAEAAGLSRKAVESLGVGVSGLSPGERHHRQLLKSRILKEIRPYKPGTEYFPEFGPHPGFSEDRQFEIRIPEKLVTQVAEKIIRGCEYVLGRKRLIQQPYSLQIYFAHKHDVGDVEKTFQKLVPTYLGPGFEVRKALEHKMSH